MTIAAQAQIITSTPATITTDYDGAVTLVFDAAQGNAGLKDYTGDVYAHTGLITQNSATASDWKYAPSWGNNVAKYKLTSLGNNKWQFVIAPSIKAFYGAATNDVVKKLAFVFRSGDNSKEGKDVGGTDIFVNVSAAVLMAQIEIPSQKSVLVNADDTVAIKAKSLLSTSFAVYINDTLLKSTTTLSIDTAYKFTTAGNYYIIAEARDTGNATRDTVSVCVRTAVVNEVRPAGLQDGITINSPTSVSFSLYAPFKNFVYLVGDFNNWTADNNYQMKKDGNYFWLTIDGLDPTKEYAFQYFVDGAIRVGDMYCTKILDPWNDKYISATVYPNLKPYPANKTEGTASVFTTTPPSYTWETVGFVRPPKEQLFIYELLLRDFTVEGTVKAAMEKLDYLKDLGVNAIELMPINEFDGNDSWGYNPTFYFAPDKAYGTPADYKKFIEECHKRGMAVILDVVFNHSWGESPMIKMWWDAANNRPAANSPYANAVAKHPYNVGSDLNHESVVTRAFFKKVLAYWLNEYRVDGFRFDLSKGFTQLDNLNNVDAWGKKDNSRIAILRDYHNAIQALQPTAYTILEHFAENSEEKELAGAGMMLWGNHNNDFCQSAMGYASNSNFSGIIAQQRGWSQPNLVGYMESHDEERVGYKTKTYGSWNMKTDSLLRAARAALSASFLIMLPGPKMMWQFGEMDYDVSIDNNGRTGRKPVRWNDLQSTGRKYVHSVYTNLLALRNRYPALFAEQNAPIFTYSITANLSQLRRVTYATDSVNIMLLGNFSNENITTTVDFPTTGTWYNYLDKTTLSINENSIPVTVSPHRFVVLIDKNIPLAEPIDTIEIATTIRAQNLSPLQSVRIFPNPVTNILSVDNEIEAKIIRIIAINGTLLREAHNTQNVDVSDLSEGIYILQVNENLAAKFVKR
ncbi:hypothetical protein FACS189467_8200 [Bacteroidia bacterium]|nr:hypothetical protein FACS189467_8200 [Bacteroidia bacterium]